MNNSAVKTFLIFSDFDGTIVDVDTYRINEELSAFIKTHKIPLVVVTARSWEGVAPYATALNLELPQITESGGVIVDPKTGDVLFRHAIDAETVKILQKIADASGAVVAHEEKEPARVSIISEDTHADAIEAELMKQGSIQVVRDIQAKSGKTLFDITPAGITKATGVQEWLELQGGIQDIHYYFLGDGMNDVPLISLANSLPSAEFVATEDAPEELKAGASKIIPAAVKNGFYAFLSGLLAEGLIE